MKGFSILTLAIVVLKSSIGLSYVPPFHRTSGRKLSNVVSFGRIQDFAQSLPTVTSLYSSAGDSEEERANDANGESEGPPAALETLMEIPEIADLLQSKKMRECMEILMTGGQEALELKMKEDPEIEEIAMMLSKIMNGESLEE